MTLLEIGPETIGTEYAMTAAKRHARLHYRPGVNALVFAIYALGAFFADLPVWPGDPTRVATMAGEDIFQTAWFLEWTPWALLHGHNIFETTSINAPVGADVAQNTGMQLLGILTAPLTLTVSPIASENLLRFLAFTLSAYAMYWVCRRIVRWTPAAFCAGALYGFSPYMVTQGSVHLNLIFVPLPPLLLAGLFDLFVTQKMAPRRRGLWLALMATAQYYISVEILATTVLVGGIGLVVLGLTCARQVRPYLRHAVVGLAWATPVLVALIAYPTWVMFFGPAHYTGPAQGFQNIYDADVLGAVLPTTMQLLAPHHLAAIGSSFVDGQIQENGSYLGVPLLALAGWFVARTWRRLWPVVIAVVAFAAWLVSLGPMVVVDHRTLKLPFNLPFHKIDRVPGLESMLPVRFSLYVVLLLAVLLAIGIDDVHARSVVRRPTSSRGRRRMTAVVATVSALACVATLLPRWPYHSVPLGTNITSRPAAFAALPARTRVLVYPYPSTFADAAMLWQAIDHMHVDLIGGYQLAPTPKGRATVLPARLQPSTVEGLLLNSGAFAAVPGYAPVLATFTTLHATSVTTGIAIAGHETTTSIHGRVVAIDRAHRTVYLHWGPKVFAVALSASTRLDGKRIGARWPLRLSNGTRVTATGLSGPGTINQQTVGELRAFIRRNAAGAVVVDLGLPDSPAVATWFRQALGPPTSKSAVAEVWQNAQVAAHDGA